MLTMSCYSGFFNVRRGWQSLNTGPRFYLRLIRRTGWLWIYTSRTTDGRPFKPKKLSVPFLYSGVPVGLAPFRGLVHLGRRNLVPILLPAHPLGGGPIFNLLFQRIQKMSFSVCLKLSCQYIIQKFPLLYETIQESWILFKNNFNFRFLMLIYYSFLILCV
jgi:hypothetical protein